MTTSLTRRTAQRLAACAVALPILAGSGLALAQTATPPAAPATAPAATPAASKTPLGDLRDMSRITVGGRVAEIFGNKFVIEDASGRALVDLGPGGGEAPMVAPGETVTVEGRFDRGTLRAAALVHEDGRRQEMREPRGPGREGPGRDGPRHERGEDGPRGEGRHGKHHGGPRDGGPRDDGPRGEGSRAGREDDRGGVMGWFSGGVDEAAAAKTLTDAGYSDVTRIDGGRRHAEFRARDAAGQDWRIAVGADNELRERAPFQAQLTEDQARAAVEKLGYAYAGDYEARKEHVDVAARTKDGTSVTVELNADGSLRKERFAD